MAEKKSKLKKPKVKTFEVGPLLQSPDEAVIRKSRRERIAIAALQGLCANESYINVDEDELAKNAVIYADALIEEMEKPDAQA